MPRNENDRALLVAFGGVVEDDVEDDLDARLMKGLHHLLNSRHLLAIANASRNKRCWERRRRVG